MPITFGESMQPEFQFSELQQILLQATNKPVQKKYSQNALKALEEIDKSMDLVSTAIAADSNERYCSIPAHLNDETVLALKAEGLITGYGKSVKITDRGRVALRDSYLKSTNALKDSRTSDKFDYRSFSRIASKKEDLKYDELLKNKNVLNLLSKYSSIKTKSNSIDKMFYKLLKIAISEKRPTDIIQATINDEISKKNPDYEYIRKYLTTNKFVLYPEASEYVQNQIFDDEKFKTWLDSTLNQIKERKGTFKLRVWLSKDFGEKPKGPSLESLGDQGIQFESKAPQGSYGAETTEEQIAKLKEIFYSVMKDTEQDVLSYYVEEGLLPKFEALQEKYSKAKADTPQKEASAEEDLREFYNNALKFINKSFNERIRNPKKKGKHHNLSQFELQNMLNAAVERLDLEDLSERIIEQNFHPLPLKLKRLVDEHPEFVKAAIQSLIKTKLIYNTKDELDVPLAAAEAASQKTTIDPETGMEIKEKKQGRGGLGRGPLDETKFLFHLLTKNIRSMSIDNEQKENFLKQALNLLEGTYSPPTAENLVAKPIVQGGKEKGSKLRKGLYQHTTPLTYAGLMHRYQEQMGEDFGNISPEQHQKMVDEIYDITHNRESAHLPHAAKSGEYTFSSKGHSELGDKSEEIIKSNLSDRLISSQKIHKKEQEPHTFMEGNELVTTPEEEDNINTASVLNKLIQKYAFKH